jgi:hypothetical protein
MKKSTRILYVFLLIDVIAIGAFIGTSISYPKILDSPRGITVKIACILENILYAFIFVDLLKAKRR